MYTEEQKTEREIKLEEREKANKEWEKKALIVHNQLKDKAELFNALKERGIESADQLVEKLSSQEKEEPKVEETLKMPTTESNSEVEDLKKKYANMEQKLQRQEVQMRTDRLMNEIKAEMKDKKEYSFLQKGLDEKTAYDILRLQHADKEKGINKSLTDYMKMGEEHYKNEFIRLGGKIEEKKEGEFQSEEAPTSSQITSTSSQDGPIDFPTLPASGSGEDVKPDLRAKIEKMGTNPITKKYDDDLAFDNYSKLKDGI